MLQSPFSLFAPLTTQQEFSNLRKGKHPVATITFASDELRDAAVATLNTLSMRQVVEDTGFVVDGELQGSEP